MYTLMGDYILNIIFNKKIETLSMYCTFIKANKNICANTNNVDVTQRINL